MTIEEFNRLNREAAGSVLEACADIDSWVTGLLAGRPFGSRNDLLEQADAAARAWTPAEVDGALSRHPRIGERPRSEAIGAANAARSATEQASVALADASVREELAAGNARYEERFGRIFLIRAAGRSPEEMLSALNERLANDDATEDAVVSGQLRQIALLRLGQAVTA